MFNFNNIDNIQICMDVPFVDHPYLIGPRGRKCQHLMDRYKSLIHFPDSNRRQNGAKLNNVIINGSSKNAEELRFQLRSRTPIRLAVQLHAFPDAYNLCNRMENAIAERSLPIRLNCADDYRTAMLKTEWRNEDVLVAFCDEFFCSHINALAFAYDSGVAEVFTMALTILPVINPWNPEISHWLIEHIFDITGCRIFYPPKEKFADQPPSYFIKGGTAAGVLKAGKFMLGLTMFQVNFIVPNSVNLNLDKIADWQRELLVHTSIEPVFAATNNNGEGSGEFLHNRAVLRSFEFCLNGVYFVRSMLLGFKKTVQSSYYNFMNDVKHMIPYSVFSNSQLYFPLYPIDDERSFDWDMNGEEFFQKFYGGPYSPTAIKQPSAPNSSNALKTTMFQYGAILQAPPPPLQFDTSTPPPPMMHPFHNASFTPSPSSQFSDSFSSQMHHQFSNLSISSPPTQFNTSLTPPPAAHHFNSSISTPPPSAHHNNNQSSSAGSDSPTHPFSGSINNNNNITSVSILHAFKSSPPDTPSIAPPAVNPPPNTPTRLYQRMSRFFSL